MSAAARKRTQFWGHDQDDDRLIREILVGHKTATVDEASEYDKPHGEFDSGGMVTGDLVDVYDLRGRLRCSIRITDVYRVRFGEIPEKLWRAEGFAGADEFRSVHREVWPGYDLTDDFEMIATHFELADVHDAEGTTAKGATE